MFLAHWMLNSFFFFNLKIEQPSSKSLQGSHPGAALNAADCALRGCARKHDAEVALPSSQDTESHTKPSRAGKPGHRVKSNIMEI